MNYGTLHAKKAKETSKNGKDVRGTAHASAHAISVSESKQEFPNLSPSENDSDESDTAYAVEDEAEIQFNGGHYAPSCEYEKFFSSVFFESDV